MADYFLSDIHLCLDWPDRDRRLVRFLDTLQLGDRLFIVGDLCDFWFSTQQSRRPDAVTPGLARLRGFVDSGGSLTLLLGNHDAWLGKFYERCLGVSIAAEPLEVDSFGLRLRLEHGHQNTAKPLWKAWLEGRSFFQIYSHLPQFAARFAQKTLDNVNARSRRQSDLAMIEAYKSFSARLLPAPDLAIFGHVHEVHVDSSKSTRVVVLGDWFEQMNYLKIDASGAKHFSIPDTNADPTSHPVSTHHHSSVLCSS